MIRLRALGCVNTRPGALFIQRTLTAKLGFHWQLFYTAVPDFDDGQIKQIKTHIYFFAYAGDAGCIDNAWWRSSRFYPPDGFLHAGKDDEYQTRRRAAMKVLEDFFSELQTDMVSICLEYCEKSVDKIYIYCSSESKVYAADIFFKANGCFTQKHEINKISDKNGTLSSERQQATLRIIIDDLKEIHKKCKEFGREMPTEIKLIYDVKKIV